MKKYGLQFLMILLVSVLSLSFLPLSAESSDVMVIDQSSLLSEEQISELNQRALDITEQYHCAVHLLLVDDPSITSDTIQDYSENLYLSSEMYGYGSSKDGFLLVVSVTDSCYWLLSYGRFANMALTDYGKEVMSEQFVRYFKQDDWEGGFKSYLDFSEEVLSLAADGQPFDRVESSSFDFLKSYGIGAFIALIVSFVFCESSKSKMLTAVQATDANQYVDHSEVHIAFRNEKFAYQTTTRSRIQSKKSTQSGTTVNKKGFSGKGGKF